MWISLYYALLPFSFFLLHIDFDSAIVAVKIIPFIAEKESAGQDVRNMLRIHSPSGQFSIQSGEMHFRVLCPVQADRKERRNQNTMEAKQRKGSCAYVPVAVLCNILWGSAIPFINIGYRLFKIASAGISSLILFAGFRFFLAGCITVLIRSISLRRPALPRKGSWKSVLKLSMFQTVGQYMLFYIAVANTASVKASIIQGLGAFVSILIASYVFRYEKMTAAKWLGGILGVLGVIVMNWKSGSFGGSFSLTGEGFMLLSMTSGALSAGLIKKYTQAEDPVVLNGWQFTVGGSIMIAAGLAGGGRLHPQSGKAFLILLYLALLSAVAYSLWSLLLKSWPISKISVFMFLQPPFGVILGLLLVRQRTDIPPARYIGALALVCACIIIINFKADPAGGHQAGKNCV